MVEILEVCPRDGLQNEERVLDADTRIELIRRLVNAGVRRMEAVSFVHPRRVPQMAQAEEVMAGLEDRDDVTYIGLVLNRQGAERAVESTVDEANIVLPLTDTFSVRNQGRSYEEMLEEARAAATISREGGLSVSLTFAVAFGCPFEGFVPESRLKDAIRAAADMDIDEIAFADTIGVGVPRQVRRIAELVEPHLPGRRLRFHFHNTRNTGYANALEAAGLTGMGEIVLDASLGGFGGCPFAPRATGNISTEDLYYALQSSTTDCTTLDELALFEITQWLSEHLGKPFASLLPRAGWFPTSDSTGAIGRNDFDEPKFDNYL